MITHLPAWWPALALAMCAVWSIVITRIHREK